MNMVEKAPAKASGKKEVKPGDVVVVDVDTLLLHDLSGYITANVFENEVEKEMRCPERVAMVFNHHFSPPMEQRVEVLERNREFARRYRINLFDYGSGNTHNVGVRNDSVCPGATVVGSDGYTPVYGTMGCFATGLGNNFNAATVMAYGKAWFMVPKTIKIELTGSTRLGMTPRDVALWLTGQIEEGGAVYRALHLTGQYIKDLDVRDRWLFPLITIDVGGRCGSIDSDEKIAELIKQYTGEPFEVATSDPGCEYEKMLSFDIGDLESQVAASPTLGNVKPAEGFGGRSVQWTGLGGHGGARLEDFRQAAEILKGCKLAPEVKFNAVPSSRETFEQCLKEGIVEIFHQVGASWFPASIGSNQAINMGAMSKYESMVSTHARNFPGRSDSPEAIIYLSSAYTVAVSAVKGCVTDPKGFLEG